MPFWNPKAASFKPFWNPKAAPFKPSPDRHLLSVTPPAQTTIQDPDPLSTIIHSQTTTQGLERPAKPVLQIITSPATMVAMAAVKNLLTIDQMQYLVSTAKESRGNWPFWRTARDILHREYRMRKGLLSNFEMWELSEKLERCELDDNSDLQQAARRQAMKSSREIKELHIVVLEGMTEVIQGLLTLEAML